MVTNRLTLHSDFEKTSFEMIPLLLFNETFIKAHVCWLKVIIYYWTLYQSFGLDNHSYFSSVHEFFTFCIPSIDMLKSPQRSMKNFPRLPSPRRLGVASIGWTEVVGRCAWASLQLFRSQATALPLVWVLCLSVSPPHVCIWCSVTCLLSIHHSARHYTWQT